MNHHVKNCHSEESDRKCPLCQKIFASLSAKNAHFQNCNVNEKIWVPTSEINNLKTSEDRHKHVPTNLSQNSKTLLEKFKDWLLSGGYSKILITYKRKLSSNSITTYTYHLKHFFQFVEVLFSLYLFNDIILISK